MIDGVKIKMLKVWPDVVDRPEDEAIPRGYLMEIVRNDEDLLQKFGQSLMTVAHKGIIKAFHWHKLQDDVWFVATGKAKVVLHDLRDDSPTKGETQVIYAGRDDYKTIVIPVGVVHGYQVLSDEPVILFYHTTEPYNAKEPDELRIPYNDPSINFDWSAA
jgi:dTDP-4-dehydrorhamnose 3,5-epimerase